MSIHQESILEHGFDLVWSIYLNGEPYFSLFFTLLWPQNVSKSKSGTPPNLWLALSIDLSLQSIVFSCKPHSLRLLFVLSGIYDLIYFYFRIATDGDYGLASGFDLDMN